MYQEIMEPKEIQDLLDKMVMSNQSLDLGSL